MPFFVHPLFRQSFVSFKKIVYCCFGTPPNGLLTAAAGITISQNKISPPTVHHIKFSFDALLAIAITRQ